MDDTELDWGIIIFVKIMDNLLTRGEKMKRKYLKSIALISLATTAASFAQQNESEVGVGVYHQTLDGLNQPVDTKAADSLANKGFGSGNYYLFVGASGASVTDSGLSFSYAGGGCMRQNSGSASNGDFDLDVQIPDGHQILGYRYYWYDASASTTSAALFIFDGAGGLTLLGNNISTGDTGFGDFYENLAVDNIIVDNSTGYYSLRFNSNEDGNNQRMCGVRFFIDSDPV